LSCCRRAGVGCVVVAPELSEVLAVGYNGPPAGAPNDSCRGTQGSCGCAHAEGNALVKLRRGRNGLVMLATTLQCEHCAGLVVNSGRVQWVVYGSSYRDPAGLGLLKASSVGVITWEALWTALESSLSGSVE
jgi:deoxycytidylate deaminase